MAVGYAFVFPGFLTPVLTQFFFPKPLTTFLTCVCRGERRKYAGKEVHLDRRSNSGDRTEYLNTQSNIRLLVSKTDIQEGKFFFFLYNSGFPHKGSVLCGKGLVDLIVLLEIKYAL